MYDPGLEQCKYSTKNAEKLIGGTILGVIISRTDNEDQSDLPPPAWGIKVKKGKKEYHCWIDMDPEGNGPGHMDIE